MAKVVLVCLRNPSHIEPAAVERHIRSFLASLSPNNLTPAPSIVRTDGQGLWVGIFNPADASAVRDCNAYLGWLADPHAVWWQVCSGAPSGSHAIFRSNRSSVELVADEAASRHIWTAQNDEMFIASSSQRAIPWFLGSFQPNSQAISWMLSSGTLGPLGGWDRCAQRLGPGATLCLDRAQWRATYQEPALTFKADLVSDAVHERRLSEALDLVLGDMHLDHARWVLPLSGGYDSRAILLKMRERQKVRTVTWGRTDALRRVGSDAWVARRVAATVGVANRYYHTDLAYAPVERIIERYLVAGDGCTDGLWAYLDGFETWRTFFADGVNGVIRGDHGFGASPGPRSHDERRICQVVGMTRWSDFAGMPTLASLGLTHLEAQSIPVSLERGPAESLVDWRDRLYQAFRIPAYTAAQSELKAPYVEIANPLLSRELIRLTRTQPEHLRRGKALFRRVIAPSDIGVRYAVETALVKPMEFLATASVKEWLSDQLGSAWLRGIFTASFADHLLHAVYAGGVGSGRANGTFERARRFARWAVPSSLRASLSVAPRHRVLPMALIALRACLVSQMLERLGDDARMGRSFAPLSPSRSWAQRQHAVL
jgi:hypothetical protein